MIIVWDRGRIQIRCLRIHSVRCCDTLGESKFTRCSANTLVDKRITYCTEKVCMLIPSHKKWFSRKYWSQIFSSPQSFGGERANSIGFLKFPLGLYALHILKPAWILHSWRLLTRLVEWHCSCLFSDTTDGPQLFPSTTIRQVRIVIWM